MTLDVTGVFSLPEMWKLAPIDGPTYDFEVNMLGLTVKKGVFCNK